MGQKTFVNMKTFVRCACSFYTVDFFILDPYVSVSAHESISFAIMFGSHRIDINNTLSFRRTTIRILLSFDFQSGLFVWPLEKWNFQLNLFQLLKEQKHSITIKIHEWSIPYQRKNVIYIQIGSQNKNWSNRLILLNLNKCIIFVLVLSLYTLRIYANSSITTKTI